MTTKKGIYIICIFLAVLIFTVFSTKLYYGSLSIEEVPMNEENNTNYSKVEYTVCLSDLYDTPGYNLTKYLNRDETLSELESLYTALKNAKYFDYYQFSAQSISIKGKYKGPSSAVSGDNSVINQVDETSGELFTPIVSTNLSMNMVSQLEGNISEGDAFSREDYNYTYEDTIPVILGQDYSGAYQIGDIIKAELFFADVEFKVKGFLMPDTAIGPYNSETEMDEYIILPVINIPKEHKSEMAFNDKVVMLEHCEGYIGIENINDYKSAVDELSSISEEHNFAMNIQNVTDQFQYLNEQYGKDDLIEGNKTVTFHNILSNVQRIGYGILLLFAELLLVIAIFLLIKSNIMRLDFKKALVVYCTEKIALLILLLCGFYVISYKISILIMEHSLDMFDKTFVMYPQSLVRLDLIIVAVISSIIFYKKARKKYEEVDKSA